ncbi:interferon lambda-3-like [Malaclemys terrapin pileata]|uniref:interferon lambda-3-like n=1 Tax=Malaclemys terrapin pileata TaxID=2991368 RepID=UPI0023A7AFE9|nr:interferon lambda-3-like [Malaclemys terrapin pileata]
MEKKNHIQSQESGKAALRHKRQLKQHPSKYTARARFVSNAGLAYETASNSLAGKMVNVGDKVLFALAIWTMTTEAFPKGTERTKCHLAKYKSLPPRELEAFKKAKDKFEDMMLSSDRKCSTRIFHRNWEVKELSVHDRVVLVEKELDFTINVLENVEDLSLSKLLSRPLEILTQIRGDLRDCTRQTHSHRHSRRLNNWLQNFHKSKETEDIVLLSNRKCNTKIFHRNWEVKELSVHDRMILVKEELHLVIDVLENFEDPSLSEPLVRPLEILRHIREDLKICTSHQPDAHRRSGRLTSWLHKFHAAKKMETPGCLEASVILNLFRLLNNDLKCAAYMESCT